MGKTLRDLLSDWNAAVKGCEQLEKEIPTIIGVACIKAIHGNFAASGYAKHGLWSYTPWVERKPATIKAYDRGRTRNKKGKLSKFRTGANGTYKGSVFNSENPLLEQTRTLKNSIKKNIKGKSVFIGVDLAICPYAEIHNEGGNGIPQRQYMPKDGEPPTQGMLDSSNEAIFKRREKIMEKFK